MSQLTQNWFNFFNIYFNIKKFIKEYQLMYYFLNTQYYILTFRYKNFYFRICLRYTKHHFKRQEDVYALHINILFIVILCRKI